jgi:hypothetical protein
MPLHRLRARGGKPLLGLATLTCAALTLVPAAATAAPFGTRTLREGMSGSDVYRLQRYLTRAGVTTMADGHFGPRTERSVKRFERETQRRVNGVVSRVDARALLRAVREAEHEPATLEAAPTEAAVLTNDGLAMAPPSAPAEVVAVIEAGNEIARKPYRYGGGHGRWDDSGYDCSGSMSYALHAGGLLDRALDSTGFMRWGEPGKGSWITTYANRGHSYMMVAGLRFDTSARRQTGSRWSDERRSSRGYTVRHPAGL